MPPSPAGIPGAGHHVPSQKEVVAIILLKTMGHTPRRIYQSRHQCQRHVSISKAVQVREPSLDAPQSPGPSHGTRLDRMSRKSCKTLHLQPLGKTSNTVNTSTFPATTITYMYEYKTLFMTLIKTTFPANTKAVET